MSNMDFMECTPCMETIRPCTLCKACVHNRQAITDLKELAKGHKEERKRENRIYAKVLKWRGFWGKSYGGKEDE